jgi:hypothetical protein
MQIERSSFRPPSGTFLHNSRVLLTRTSNFSLATVRHKLLLLGVYLYVSQLICVKLPGFGQRSIDDDRTIPPIFPKPIAADPWVPSSLLQKAIRRGEADLAERAAITLYRLRGKGIWRRFLVIAFEDVGIASRDVIVETTEACTDPSWREELGGDEPALRHVARLLALKPKDRSPDHLVCVAHSHPAFERVRDQVGSMSIVQRLDLVADASHPLPARAVATWYASGVEWGDERRIGRGDLDALVRVFIQLGVPNDVIAATRIAAKRTREPIVVMAPLLWLAASAAGDGRTIECPIPDAPLIGEIPSYALDKHTAIGKAAIHRLARENAAVREVLATYVPEYRANETACMAAFYADAAPVALRFDWNGSVQLERLGIETDMLGVGVPFEGITAVLTVVCENLDHLNAIRAEMFSAKRRSSKPRG